MVAEEQSYLTSYAQELLTGNCTPSTTGRCGLPSGLLLLCRGHTAVPSENGLAGASKA